MKNVLTPIGRLALRVMLVVVLLLALAPAVFAQDDFLPEKLPATLEDLLGPAGLGVVVTAIVGLLKRLNSKKHPGLLGRFGDWLNATPFNQLFVSVVTSLVVIAVVQLILYLGWGSYAENVWFYFGVAWLTSQGVYNGQKTLSKTVARALVQP